MISRKCTKRTVCDSIFIHVNSRIFSLSYQNESASFEAGIGWFVVQKSQFKRKREEDVELQVGAALQLAALLLAG